MTAKINFRQDQKPGWYFLQLEDDFSKYYRWFCLKGKGGWNLPMNGPHVTFIAGEKDVRLITPQDLQPWIDKNIKIEYDGIVRTDDRSYWINCVSEELNRIRYSLNLGEKRFGYHITLGNNK